MKMTTVISLLLLSSTNVLANTPDIYSIPQNAMPSSSSYNDWSNAERWSLSQKLDVIKKRQRYDNTWCNIELNHCNITTLSNAFLNESIFSTVTLSSVTSQMCMMQQNMCRERNQVDAMKKRDSAKLTFKQSIMGKSMPVLATDEKLDIAAMYQQFKNEDRIPLFLRPPSLEEDQCLSDEIQC